MSDAKPAIVAPNVRDLSKLAATLVDWLAVRLSGASAIRVSNLSYPLGAGMSHETILFDAAWHADRVDHARGMVVRIKPSDKTVYYDDMFNQQYQIMNLMHRHGAVRVATPLWLEHDTSILGAPFFVMEKVQGRVAVSYPPYSKSGWLVDETPANRRRLWHDAVSQLAAIQLVPVTDAPFLTLPGGDSGFDQEVDRWRRYINWVDPSGQQLVLRGAFDRLLAMAPADKVEGIVWGDARLGNMMVGADHTIAAVMDWEQPSLGGALHDLGWWLQSDYNQTHGQGFAPLDGMGTRLETIALWSEVSGKSADTIAWYEAFACLKMEALALRMMALRDMPASVKAAVQGTRTNAMLDAL